jgi:superfamily II DNA/RNA helicase/cold shock CspA family protein
LSPSFSDLGVPDRLAATLAARGIDTPLPIQALTIPDARAGRDVCGQAPTGSGKTIAFGIPLVGRVGRAEARRPRGLVLVPTRELATQVAGELEWLGSVEGVRVAACYGGVGLERQRRALRHGVDVLVACPGRLGDLIGRGDADLSAVEIVVVDEADRMADMGFLPQVRRLLDQTSTNRQTLLFSATLDATADSLVRRYQRNPVVHRHAAAPEERGRVTHLFWEVDDGERVETCADLIRDSGSTIVFCRTRRRADRVARQLASAGIRSDAIHGSRSQPQRDRALAAFGNGAIDALVATDVAARGIHVDDIECVVHYDPAPSVTDYTHRAGRTARAGASGLVISLVQRDQANEARDIQRQLKLPLGLTRPQRHVAAPATAPELPDEPAVAAVDAGEATGTIRWFNPRKGYGFIARDGADDVFVHASSIAGVPLRKVRNGSRVAFEIRPGRNGEQAWNVALVA